MGGRTPRWESDCQRRFRLSGHAAGTRHRHGHRVRVTCFTSSTGQRITSSSQSGVRTATRRPCTLATATERASPRPRLEPPCRAVAWARERGETRKGCGVRGRDETCVLRASTGPVPLTQLLSPTFSFCRHPSPFSPPLQVPQAPPPATAIETRGKAARCALIDSARGCACHPCAAPRRRSAAPPAAATVRGAADPR